MTEEVQTFKCTDFLAMVPILEKLIPGYKPMEIRLYQSSDYLRIRETLTRVGVGSYKIKTLWQTCHLVHDKGRYFIVHFLELQLMMGKITTISPEDIQRRNAITSLLKEWNLCYTVNRVGKQSSNKLRIISYSDRHNWDLVPKVKVM